MKVLIVEPNKNAYAKDIVLDDKSVREIVGDSPTLIGPIEANGFAIIYNQNKAANASLSYDEYKHLYKDKYPYIICATSDASENFVSLTDQQIEFCIDRLLYSENE